MDCVYGLGGGENALLIRPGAGHLLALDFISRYDQFGLAPSAPPYLVAQAPHHACQERQQRQACGPLTRPIQRPHDGLVQQIGKLTPCGRPLARKRAGACRRSRSVSDKPARARETNVAESAASIAARCSSSDVSIATLCAVRARARTSPQKNIQCPRELLFCAFPDINAWR